MGEKEQFKRVMEDPSTKGEESQANRLQKFHKDAEVILDIRGKLENLKSELNEDQKDLDDKINILRNKKKEITQETKRYYDKTILKRRPRSVLSHLFSYFKVKKVFSDKYRKDKKVLWKFFNFISDREIFFPSMSVYLAVKNLMVIQQQLRPYFRKIYRMGWLDETGEEILQPIEFNILGEMERVLHDESIINYLIYSKQPIKAIKKINPFLGYYLSVTRDAKTKGILIKAAEKSLKNIVFSDSEDSKKIPKILEKINQFISLKVDEEFLIPLFETTFLEVYTEEKIRETIHLEEIISTDYMASENMHMHMANKKSEYAAKKKSKAKNIEEELDFIQELIEIVNKKVQLKTKQINFLDYILLVYHDFDNDIYNLRKNNIAGFLNDLSDFFYKTYEFLFIEGLHLRINQVIEIKRIIDVDTFANEIHTIKTVNRAIAEYMNSGYTFDILQKKNLEKKHSIFIDALNKVVDTYYSMGEKISIILGSHDRMSSNQKSHSVTPIAGKELGNSSIPYSEFKIVNINPAGKKRYSLTDKTVYESLKEIMTFCLCIAYKFEHSVRDFSKTWRKESIHDKINNIHKLEDKLEQLHSEKESNDLL